MIDYSSVRSELESEGFSLSLKKEKLLNFKCEFTKGKTKIIIDWYIGGYIKKIIIKRESLRKEYTDLNQHFFEEIKKIL